MWVWVCVAMGVGVGVGAWACEDVGGRVSARVCVCVCVHVRVRVRVWFGLVDCLCLAGRCFRARPRPRTMFDWGRSSMELRRQLVSRGIVQPASAEGYCCSWSIRSFLVCPPQFVSVRRSCHAVSGGSGGCGRVAAGSGQRLRNLSWRDCAVSRGQKCVARASTDWY